MFLRIFSGILESIRFVDCSGAESRQQQTVDRSYCSNKSLLKIEKRFKRVKDTDLDQFRPEKMDSQIFTALATEQLWRQRKTQWYDQLSIFDSQKHAKKHQKRINSITFNH